MTMSIVASVVVGVASIASGAHQAKKSRDAQKDQSLMQRLTIEGQAPQLLDIGTQFEQTPQIAGTELGESLRNLRYNPESSFMDILGSQQQQQDIPPEVLEQLMQEQGAQYAASGGPVGRPEDTYYFTVEDIEGMMQEPDPMVQQVGAGLAQQMGPGMGAVPATPSQLQMMAQGGQPLYRAEGGRTNLLTTNAEQDMARAAMKDEYFDEVVELEQGEDVEGSRIPGLWPWEAEEGVSSEVGQAIRSISDTATTVSSQEDIERFIQEELSEIDRENYSDIQEIRDHHMQEMDMSETEKLYEFKDSLENPESVANFDQQIRDSNRGRDWNRSGRIFTPLDLQNIRNADKRLSEEKGSGWDDYRGSINTLQR